ncbi:MAG: THUMP domain-containing protein [Nitrospirota bacterium]|nr:THUMP domain-containing protein [Nitrospirota bacterium]
MTDHAPHSTPESPGGSASEPLEFFAPCAMNIEALLAYELNTMGMAHVRPTRGGVAFEGDLAAGYRACLWSRLASRVLLPIGTFYAADPQALYKGIQGVDWQRHVAPEGTLVVDFSTSGSAIDHSHFGALKVKDAIVDQFREACGVRPSVDTVDPDLRVNVYLYRDQATVSVDLSGDALHRRGYRMQGGKAPLKETLAAAILAHARWPDIAADGGQFVDLMCGSGTLLIEAAMMAADFAPGLARGDNFGFTRWLQHDEAVWDRVWTDARDRRLAGLKKLGTNRIHGYDRDPRAVEAVRENVVNGGLEGYVTVARRELADTRPEPGPPGLVAVNPPYGERLGADDRLNHLYAALGGQLKDHFSGWRAAVFTGNPGLAHHMRLGADKKHTLYNGAIPCKLFHYRLN